MTLTVKTGRGYEPADLRDDEDRVVGALKVDASYSPVRRVSYTVDNARFGKRTDLDKLVVELETDGTLDPKMAIEHSATILQQQLSAFVDLDAIAIASKSTKALNCCWRIVAECSIAIFGSSVPSVSNSTTSLSKSVLLPNLALSTV